ncbi:hypothetical protein QBZ16_003039 [Prototheca wickerhamii]|uniref:Neurochondrin n=1 Tax=Prototheca wickerhamii TaxID=3111 RepID=A0AAD9IKR4_PROWI|nr:hypothetical protein QBZ16_003039 [Prototheca wickerhamii]
MASRNDNKKFAGLLLVTKAAPLADLDILTRTYQAVGLDFLRKLLLPLQEVRSLRGVRPVENPEELATFGLSIWARLVDVPEVARSEELCTIVPLLLKVVRSGGVRQALAAMHTQSAQEVEALDLKTVGEALRCVLAAAAADPGAGRVALESGAVRTTTDLWARVASRQRADRQTELELLAAQLLDALLRRQPDPEHVFVENEDALVRAVPLLAAALHCHNLESKDETLLQLISLSALERFVALSGVTRSKSFRQQLIASASSWATELQRGLLQVLQSRSGPAQRACALQLTAGTLRLLGPRWAVEDGPDFVQLAAIVARVETGVLLLDALADSAAVLVPDPSASRSAGEAVGPRLDSEASEPPTPGPAPRPGDTQRLLASVTVPESMPWRAGPAVPARERAAGLLPVCFEVLEGAIEALAEAEDPDLPGVEPFEPRVALAVLRTVEEAADSVLQFLEQVAGAEGDGDAVRESLAVASVRLLGRFLVECPLAFGDRVRRLLPFLLSCGADRAGDDGAAVGQGTVFLLPVLVQVTEKPPAAGPETTLPVAEAPGVPEPERDAWLRALAAPPALLPLLAYGRRCALCALRAVTDEAMHRADVALLHASQVLAAVLESARAGEPGAGEAAALRALLEAARLLLKERGPRSMGPLLDPGGHRLRRLPGLRDAACHSAAIVAFLDASDAPAGAVDFDPGTRAHALAERVRGLF